MFGSGWALAKYLNSWVTQIEICWVLSCIFGLTICLFSELRHAIVYAIHVNVHKALWSTIWRLFTRTPEFCVLLLASIVADQKRKIMNYAYVENPEKGHTTYNLRNIETRYSLVVLKFCLSCMYCHDQIGALPIWTIPKFRLRQPGYCCGDLHEGL